MTTANLSELQIVAAEANIHYWNAHGLLTAVTLMAEKLDDDEELVPEILALLNMASMKVLDIQACFNPHIPVKGGQS